LRKTVLIITVLFLSYGSAYSYDLGFLEIHGFASPGYMISTDNNYIVQSEDGSFQFNEFGISFSTTVKDDIYIGFQLLSRDMGTVGNNDFKLNWGLIDYQWRDELGVKLGRIKMPHGLYNDTRDYDMLRTAILLPQGIYNEYIRETQARYDGGCFYGNISLGKAGFLGYNLFLGVMQIESDGGVAKMITKGNMKFKSADVDYVIGGQLKWHTPLTGLMLNGSLYQADVTYNSESRAAPVEIKIDMPEVGPIVYSAEYSIGNLTAAAEYMIRKRDQTIITDMSRIGRPDPTPIQKKIETEAYYGSFSYRLTDWFEAGAYYSVCYPDKDDRDGKNQVTMGNPDFHAWQKDLAISTRFDITDFWLVKMEFHFMDGAALCTESDNPDGFDKDWTLFAIKTTFSF